MPNPFLETVANLADVDLSEIKAELFSFPSCYDGLVEQTREDNSDDNDFIVAAVDSGEQEDLEYCKTYKIGESVFPAPLVYSQNFHSSCLFWYLYPNLYVL